MQMSIEREYPYQLKRNSVAVISLLLAGLALVMAYFAYNNTQGLRIRNFSVTLSPNQASVFLWGISAILFATVGLCAALIWMSFRVQQRLAFTPTELILPRSLWSAREKSIRYQDVTDIKLRTSDYQRWLEIYYAGGKGTIHAAMLPSNQVFEEAIDLLVSKVSATRTSY